MESRKLRVCNVLINEAYEIMHSLCFDQETHEYVPLGDTEAECDDFTVVMGDLMKTRREFNRFIDFHTATRIPDELRKIVKNDVKSIIARS